MMTPLQRQTYDYIKAYWDEHGHSPSFRDIASHMNRSVSFAYSTVMSLCSQGFAKHQRGRVRSIMVKPITYENYGGEDQS